MYYDRVRKVLRALEPTFEAYIAIFMVVLSIGNHVVKPEIVKKENLFIKNIERSKVQRN
jgi:hypothetical protein